VIACAGAAPRVEPVRQGGKLTYYYNLADFEHSWVQAKDPLRAGRWPSSWSTPPKG